MPAYEERGARFREDTSQGGARLSDDRGDVRRVLVYRQGIGCCSPRPALLVDDALAMAKMKRVAGTLRKEREGILNWWKKRLDRVVSRRAQLPRPVRPEHCQGLQEHRLL